jgi:hypothetical protein
MFAMLKWLRPTEAALTRTGPSPNARPTMGRSGWMAPSWGPGIAPQTDISISPLESRSRQTLRKPKRARALGIKPRPPRAPRACPPLVAPPRGYGGLGGGAPRQRGRSLILAARKDNGRPCGAFRALGGCGCFVTRFYIGTAWPFLFPAGPARPRSPRRPS